ncbi:hypothetical protein ES703_10306 [subsurface metagenome]
MKFSFSALLLRFLWKLLGKRVEKVLTELDSRVVADAMRYKIEKRSDKEINQTIEDMKEGNYHGLEDMVSAFARAGITQDVMLQWLKDEKFLREHKRKYHPESR